MARPWLELHRIKRKEIVTELRILAHMLCVEDKHPPILACFVRLCQVSLGHWSQ
jgi:hypothetical protein